MPVIQRLTRRPVPKDLDTGDLLFLSTSSGEGTIWTPFRLTGHVAIVFFKDEKEKDIPDHPVPQDHPRAVPFVLEAVKNASNPTPPPSRISQVREIPYSVWAQKFATFWHGRMKKPSGSGLAALSQKDQMDFVKEALRHFGKPYSSWRGPSLDDDGSDARFSCSKLVLVAAYKALGIPLDGHQGPKRRVPSVAVRLRKSPYIFDV